MTYVLLSLFLCSSYFYFLALLTFISLHFLLLFLSSSYFHFFALLTFISLHFLLSFLCTSYFYFFALFTFISLHFLLLFLSTSYFYFFARLTFISLHFLLLFLSTSYFISQHFLLSFLCTSYFSFVTTYKSDSKVLHYFGNGSHGCFCRGGELHWTVRCLHLLILSYYYWVCSYCLRRSLEIHAFTYTWPYLIIDVIAARAKYLKLSGYCTEINCDFTLHTTNILGYFCSVMAQFLTRKVKVPELVCTAWSCIWRSNHIEWSNTHLLFLSTSYFYFSALLTFISQHFLFLFLSTSYFYFSALLTFISQHFLLSFLCTSYFYFSALLTFISQHFLLSFLCTSYFYFSAFLTFISQHFLLFFCYNIQKWFKSFALFCTYTLHGLGWIW